MCDSTIVPLNQIISIYLFSQYASTRTLSNRSLNAVVDALYEQIQAEVTVSGLGSSGYPSGMVVLHASPLYSVVNTNAFQLSLPGSNEYQSISSFYPVHDTAMFNNVRFIDENEHLVVFSVSLHCLFIEIRQRFR